MYDSLIRPACLIDGQWIRHTLSPPIEIRNPATGQVIGQVPSLGREQVLEAIDAAYRAFPNWKRVSSLDRSQVLRRWRDLILKSKEALAVLLTSEQGKPIAEARNEIEYAASFVEWFAEEAKRVQGEVLASIASDRRLMVLKEPIGVCAAITPWNFPAAMVTRKVAPALAVGCTIVLKPAEQTPLTAIALGELACRAGLPPGTINIVTGDAEAIGRELTASPIVRKLSFTGSTEVGKLLMAQCSSSLKRLSLELGGNAPFIIFADADIDQAVQGFMDSKFRNSGQTCVCANRLLVASDVYDSVSKRLQTALQKLKLGNGLEPGVQQGPLIDLDAVGKVERLLGEAVAMGAQIVEGGKRHSLGRTWFQPTLVCEVDHRMQIAQEEVFGPVVSMIRFQSEDEALRMANDTRHGLAAYFYTRDHRRIWRVVEGLEYGMVASNTGTLSTALAPFGGTKESGFGREGSSYGMDEYLQLKYYADGGLV